MVGIVALQTATAPLPANAFLCRRHCGPPPHPSSRMDSHVPRGSWVHVNLESNMVTWRKISLTDDVYLVGLGCRRCRGYLLLSLP